MGSIVVLVGLMVILMAIGKVKSKFDVRDLLVPLLLALVQTSLVLYEMLTMPWPD